LINLLTQGNGPAMVTLLILLGMLVVFILEVYPPEVTAMCGAALMVVFGYVPVNDVLKAFGNPAPWTIAAMFIVSGGMVRTGLINELTRVVTRHAAGSRFVVLLGVGLFVAIASAFTNNTPLVAVMIPVTVQLAHAMSLSPSKLLIPLSYVTVLGGMITMIGTSTNLLVDGVAREAGLPHFTLFEIAPAGIAVLITGMATLWLLVPRFLPDRDSMTDMLGSRKRMKFFTDVVVPEGSQLIGQGVMSVGIFKREGMRVIDVLRGDESLRRAFPDVTLAEGDRVVLRTEMQELLGLKDSNQVALVDRVGSKSTTTVEALISPDCKLVGRSLGSLRLRRRYGVYPLAMHRRNQNIGRQLDEVVVRVGDTLLLEGAPEDIRRLAQDVDLIDLSETTEKPFRRGRAPLVLAVVAAIVVLSGFEFMPIQILAMLGVVILLATRTVEPEEAYANVSASLMVLIFSMLVVGQALENSGAIQVLVDWVSPWLRRLPPIGVLLVLYFMTQILTELLSNNAVAVVVTPIAIALAVNLGLDPRAFVVAVMFAATLAFATPIGYQTNTMVYGPGGYKFSDYMRIGIPLNIVSGLTACLVIPMFWPLVPVS
jgi:di/tricarboxylate transporter